MFHVPETHSRVLNSQTLHGLQVSSCIQRQQSNLATYNQHLCVLVFQCHLRFVNIVINWKYTQE